MAAYTGNFRLGPDAGRVVIKTGRAGLAAKAGHDLTIEVTRWSAQVEVPAEEDGGLTAATVSAELDLGSLEVREGTGGAKPLTDGDRREIKKQMGGILGGATASFASSRIIPTGASGGAIEGTVTLNGKTQPARLQVTDARLRAGTGGPPRWPRPRSGSSRTPASSARSSSATRSGWSSRWIWPRPGPPGNAEFSAGAAAPGGTPAGTLLIREPGRWSLLGPG